MQYIKYTFFLGRLLCIYNKLYISITNKYAAVRKYLDKSSTKLYHIRRWICILPEFEFVLFYRSDNI